MAKPRELRLQLLLAPEAGPGSAACDSAAHGCVALQPPSARLVLRMGPTELAATIEQSEQSRAGHPRGGLADGSPIKHQGGGCVVQALGVRGNDADRPTPTPMRTTPAQARTPSSVHSVRYGTTSQGIVSAPRSWGRNDVALHASATLADEPAAWRGTHSASVGLLRFGSARVRGVDSRSNGPHGSRVVRAALPPLCTSPNVSNKKHFELC
mmetsp:Transcript_6579/g.16774  ORF Transcript_6579/g.16774 Transcript_6579/m.16774 type:complete len:211 (+) Transcript_6579:586-1218(+)